MQSAPVIKSIPAPSYAALPFVLAPLLSNPVTMAANRATAATSPFDAVQRIGMGMLDMLPGLGKLAEILPQDTLVWKLGLLAEGCAYLDTRYHLVRPPWTLPGVAWVGMAPTAAPSAGVGGLLLIVFTLLKFPWRHWCCATIVRQAVMVRDRGGSACHIHARIAAAASFATWVAGVVQGPGDPGHATPRVAADADDDALQSRVQVRQRVFVVAGGGDWLIPSADEAEALQALLPHCRTRVLPLRSHALLQDSDMDLAALLREEGFYTHRRMFSGNGADLPQRSPGLGIFGRRARLPHCVCCAHCFQAAMQLPLGVCILLDLPRQAPCMEAPADTVRVSACGRVNACGSPGDVSTCCRPMPVELPTAAEFAADAESLDTLRSAVSPVFFSTAADGTVEEGLQHLALEAGKPVLLVGNHQTFPIDLGPLVEGVRPPAPLPHAPPPCVRQLAPDIHVCARIVEAMSITAALVGVVAGCSVKYRVCTAVLSAGRCRSSGRRGCCRGGSRTLPRSPHQRRPSPSAGRGGVGMRSAGCWAWRRGVSALNGRGCGAPTAQVHRRAAAWWIRRSWHAGGPCRSGQRSWSACCVQGRRFCCFQVVPRRCAAMPRCRVHASVLVRAIYRVLAIRLARLPDPLSLHCLPVAACRHRPAVHWHCRARGLSTVHDTRAAACLPVHMLVRARPALTAGLPPCRPLKLPSSHTAHKLLHNHMSSLATLSCRTQM